MSENPTDLSKEFDGDSFDAEIRRVCGILESVAKRFAPNSDECLAIRDAALAYTVVHLHEITKKSYEKFRLAFDGQLTEEMKADLRRHGIDPDELDSDKSSLG